MLCCAYCYLALCTVLCHFGALCVGPDACTVVGKLLCVVAVYWYCYPTLTLLQGKAFSNCCKCSLACHCTTSPVLLQNSMLHIVQHGVCSADNCSACIGACDITCFISCWLTLSFVSCHRLCWRCVLGFVPPDCVHTVVSCLAVCAVLLCIVSELLVITLLPAQIAALAATRFHCCTCELLLRV